MLTNFSETGPPISDAEIVAIELLANGNFPSEFRNLYLSVNGGYLDDADGGNSLLLSGFVPIKYGRVPMEQAYNELVQDFPTLAGKVPFAFDEGGNYFLISVSGNDAGNVGIWIMDTEEYHIVADDFREFFSTVIRMTNASICANLLDCVLSNKALVVLPLM